MSPNSSNNNTEEQVLTLSKLTARVKKTLASGFPGEFWVIAEISEIHLNNSGHAYLELIEKDANSNKILARMRATIWAYTYRMLRPYFEGTTGYQLSSGIKVLILVSLEYHPLYSLSLNIKDIDPSYTLGDLARKKAEIIGKLKTEGVIEMNRQLPFPLVPQRIAVISSETAAGYGDFINSLSGNIYDFHFNVTLFQAIMQGEKAEESIIQALENIYENESEFDVVVLIRGGGAQIELECFNNYDLAFHITQFPIPLLTGIGHERDETVADLVAHKKLKTPTAVAEFLVDSLAVFLGKLEEYEELLMEIISGKLASEKENISRLTGKLALAARENLYNARNTLTSRGFAVNNTVKQSLTKAKTVLNEKSFSLKFNIKEKIEGQNQILEQVKRQLQRSAGQKVKNEGEKLESLTRIIDLYNPKNILARGFSITIHKGKALKDSSVTKKEDELTTILHKGKLKSKVQ